MKNLLVLSLTLSLMLVFGLSNAAGNLDTSDQTFKQYLQAVKLSAMENGIGESTLALLDNIEQDPRMIKFDKRQPEFTQTFEQYLKGRVSKSRIKSARKYYKEHKVSLEKIAEHYDIDAQYLLAFWGLESNFGSYQGKYSILRSLATLGYNPRRAKFFTAQLHKALTILDEGHISPDKFVGGWAGAMGQNQFMPSSFLAYAQDFDGDGKKNIWTNQLDVWASIAYYLQQNGWRKGKRWGLKVSLDKDIDFAALKPAKTPKGCRAFRHHTVKLSLKDWQTKGVSILGLGALSEVEQAAPYAMVVPQSGEENAYLVGPNFKAILAYNCANKYAVSIGLLADKVKD